jgi:transposase/gamma-glutamylcyclotransferase (GGCT)/AIG2-like uncharacterized protein YtfP
MIKQEMLQISAAELQALKDENQSLKEQLAQLQIMIFGSKRERFISQNDPDQLSLFDLPEVEEVEVETKEVSYTRKTKKEKKQPLRTELPAHLPRKEEVIEPENIPQGAKKIGESVTEVLEYTPAEIFVRRIIRPKYIVSSTDEKTEIAIADLPALPIPKSNAGAGLIAYILVSKFVDHLPFYRQRQIFKRQKLHIAESTLNGWFTASSRLLLLLYQALQKTLLETDYLMADETTIKVLTKDKPGASHKGYHWVYYDPVRKLVFFDYRKGRSKEGPNEILQDFTGYLQTDGYTVYSHLVTKGEISLLACMAHARRKFENAKENDKARSHKMLKMMQKLYAIERQAKEEEMDFEQIKAVRQEKAVPVLDEMEIWMQEEIYKVTPASGIGKAIAYTMNLWSRLKRYVEDGRFHIDNNLIENSIRPVALGRKNYLFAGSHEAAQRAAMFYSFFASCKINEVEPYQWLKNTLEVINDYPANKLHELLPGYKKIEE